MFLNTNLGYLSQIALKHYITATTVLPPNMGNRVAVGKPRAYRDRRKSALCSNAVLTN